MSWFSSITHRWNCPGSCGPADAAPGDDLRRKELALNRKEKELLNKERELRHQIKKYNRRNNRRASADLKAANKLKRAKKQLLSALDSRDRLKTKSPINNYNYLGRIKKVNDGKRKPAKQSRGFINTLITACPLQCFTDLFHKPCHCYSGKVLRAQNLQRSLLRSLCGGPRGCNAVQRKTFTGEHQKMLHMCRCEEDRRRYGAGDCYLMTLRQTPQVWIHQRWPRFYPYYLDARHQWKNLSYSLLFCAGILIWTPCIICLELCKCFCCACCSDF